MALRDITTTVSDGLLGFATAKGTGVFAAIGASSVSSREPVVVTGSMGAAKIKELLGLSPLADAVMDSVENGANRVYCFPVVPSVKGTVGEISKQAEGTGSLAVTGSPYNYYQVTVEITGGGTLNSALFRYSVDGGATLSEELTVPLTGEFPLPGTGLTLKFSEGESADTAFVIGDTYSATTTAPQLTNQEALEQVGRLAHFNELIEFVYIVGDSTPALWAAVSAAQEELESAYKKPLFFIFEASRPGAAETVEAYVRRLEQERKGVKNKAIQVVAARSLYTRMDGVTQEINNAGIVCGLYARSPVQKSIARTRDSEGMGVGKDKMLELRPTGIEEHLDALDDAGYLTWREYYGLDGYYVTAPRMMSPDGSDYRYAEDVRVLHEILRSVRKAGLPELHDDIDLENLQHELEKKAEHMGTPLERLVEEKAISSFTMEVLENPGFMENETLYLRIRYVSRGIVREINVDVGRAQAE